MKKDFYSILELTEKFEAHKKSYPSGRPPEAPDDDMRILSIQIELAKVQQLAVMNGHLSRIFRSLRIFRLLRQAPSTSQLAPRRQTRV